VRVLLLDNYDSFTYNLLQYLAELGAEVMVRRNDAVSVQEAEALGADALVVSPGPGRPEDAGISVELIRTLGPRIPTLGVCLGHQAIAVAFGGEVVLAPAPLHGKTSLICHDGTDPLFSGLPSPFAATRYHSLCVRRQGLPAELAVTATSLPDGLIMALRHRRHPIVGVQFHPESILTETGRRILANFLSQGVQGHAALPAEADRP
jgi:anthranilate synthase/aminodeoxychorismate synthase-like glutamine amidotransferase